MKQINNTEMPRRNPTWTLIKRVSESMGDLIECLQWTLPSPQKELDCIFLPLTLTCHAYFGHLKEAPAMEPLTDPSI